MLIGLDLGLMEKEINSSSRIAKNTLLLYFRMLLLMGINLYTSRVVLEALGASDYGIYSIVGGFVTMFSVVSGSLTTAISRYITFELGSGNARRVQKVFSTSVIIQIVLSLLIIVLAETIGLWFLNTRMTIPLDRMYAANFVFQFSILTFVINIISVPYNALIVAHERMSAFAYIGFFQAICTLSIAVCVSAASMDRLVLYSFLLGLLAIIIRLMYGIYCKKHFPESKLLWYWDKIQIKEIFSFSGWNFIGSTSGILRDQGVNILLNLFYGPIVNAARGIAIQISGAIASFSNNFMMALNPQITKNYASGDITKMQSLVFRGASFSFYLLLFLSLPVLIETPMVLEIWLKHVPEYTVVFVRLVLIQILIDSLSNTLITVMLATGNIKKYQLLVGGCTLLNFPFAYILLKLNFQPQSTLVVSIILSVVSLYLRLRMLHSMFSFPIDKYLKEVIGPALIVTLLSFPIPCYLAFIMEASILRFVTISLITLLAMLIIVFYIGCSKQEQDYLKNLSISLIQRIKK